MYDGPSGPSPVGLAPTTGEVALDTIAALMCCPSPSAWTVKNAAATTVSDPNWSDSFTVT
ncbi:hypothetical protein Enr13x_69820 [Stieleria neptunia]|uniref:Uncharacterized protein n=1 Tax=Stieleria neptunia TaxID=2527979 RepID=A0A518I1T2_9BACT|nr:hypothetical protein Enr13x_69820 [Stieleria neptunia]